VAHGIVVTYAPGDAHRAGRHMDETRTALAKALAALKGFEFGGELDPGVRYEAPLYFVPKDSLVGIEAGRALGIRTSEDLYGGVVPFAFAATKTIAHPLIAPDARSPRGWSESFAERVRDVVLPGFSAFALSDALAGGKRLLAHGPVRMKLGQGLGGHDQFVIASAVELERALAGVDEEALATYGLVIERNLAEVTTYSIGQYSVAGVLASYCGTQHTTCDNRGEAAYGGSELLVARGGYDALERLALEPQARHALTQARAFDAAACEAFPGLFASRRNYDAVRGCDVDGEWFSGVLEQSWRLGGASGAEVVALAAFLADRSLQAVRARSIEAYGEEASVPPGALVHYRGVDPEVGPLVKFSVVGPYVRGG
jgi:hypothetical protein